jgi:hypothetical protein
LLTFVSEAGAIVTDGTIARAFELARSGSYVSLEAVRKQLKKEGYSMINEHLAGPSFQKQLNAALKAALK